MDNKRIRKRKRAFKRKVITVVGVFIIGVVSVVIVACSNDSKAEDKAVIAPTLTPDTQIIIQEDTTTTPITEPVEADPYPYSIMSKDWGAEVYEQGYTYYEIPASYKMAGGVFPEVAQVYLFCICKDAGVDYYTALALIERESGYRYDAIGDGGASKGLMQIQERYHLERMEAVGASDLFNPYDNMRVGVNYLKEIQDKYLDSSGANCVLMVYNMGYSGAKKLWDQGIYSTEYTRQILQRAQEIKQELQDQ